VRIVTLVENTKPEGREDLEAEHGLSLYVEHAGRRILFDAGASEAFCRNAERLGVSIPDVDVAVLSHHHYDHGGGLPCFLKTNRKARVYLRKCEEGDPTVRSFGLKRKYIGLDREMFHEYPGRFEFVERDTEILPGVFILTDIGKRYPLPRGNRRLFVERAGMRTRDAFEHEQMMVIQAEAGLVAFTGCAHRGVLNVVETATRQFPGVAIQAVLGGFHLVGLPPWHTMARRKREIEGIGREMLRYGIGRAYTGHCTGLKAYRMLADVMGERLEYLATGSEIVL